jgi:hypothetical protein
MVQISLGKNQDSISKITRVKRAGGAAYVVECLPSKREALSSNSSTAKKKTKQEGRGLLVTGGMPLKGTAGLWTLPLPLFYSLGIMR